MKPMLKGLALGAVLAAAGAADVAAATLSIDTVGGVFASTTARNGMANGTGTSSLDWGVAAYGGWNSGYGFEGAPVSADAAGSYVIGTFSHRNGAIWSNSPILETASLGLNISGSLMGQAFSLAPVLSITHNETLNNARPCAAGGANPCGDRVDFGAFAAWMTSVTVADMIYTLVIEGFLTGPEGQTVTSFFTAEDQISQAHLVARLTTTPVAPVPLPAAGWLLLGGLGALAAARRRRG